MVEGLKVATDKKAAAEQVKALYKLFAEKDCTMVEVRGRVGGQLVGACGCVQARGWVSGLVGGVQQRGARVGVCASQSAAATALRPGPRALLWILHPIIKMKPPFLVSP
jgi:hypothetical protein